ncbi:hypothetical protein B0H16DRAFT_1750792 [Mycena metata]|uniref:Uncharacterized protein n=1 Tax=Mycena metata TaxID=1033252 RepID=A0AAD7DPQ9_9AGAR|nr:hypothetical protein B0H16DRAFT_1750792 [Mycena metata]
MASPQPASSIKAAAPLRMLYNSRPICPRSMTPTPPLRGSSKPLWPSSLGSAAPPHITAPTPAWAPALPCHSRRIDLGSYRTAALLCGCLVPSVSIPQTPPSSSAPPCPPHGPFLGRHVSRNPSHPGILLPVGLLATYRATARRITVFLPFAP